MTKRKKNKSLRKEEIAEDWCFVCKDGGQLLICDYGRCLKAYHPRCVGKDDSFLTSDGRWTCRWHSCLFCHRSSSYHCYCCVNAVCNRCILYTEFARIKGKYGFCNDCLKLALLVEENMDVDSEGESVNLRDRETYEGLFREYYETVKEKERFDKSSLFAAKDRVNRDNEYQPTSNLDEGSEEEDEQLVSDYEGSNDGKPHKRGCKKKRYKLQQQKLQRKVKSKKKEFIGWGSKALVDFLQFIGQDTSETLSQHDVSLLINNYVKKNDLCDPVKKRRIICDARLQTVLGKKKVNIGRIYKLLEAHFAENEQNSEEEELDDDLEENDREIFVASEIGKKSDPNKKLTKKYLTPAPSQFAALVPENIKLVYLKKSLVLEMIKLLQSNENKIIGSFVRVKSDPCDYSQRNSHQLVQITGIKQGSIGKGKNETVLQVSNTFRDICLSMLSDDDFTSEECEDLRERVKAGVLKKLTVVELEQRARVLHEDITKHWIARKLSLLEKLIDQANEKGWRYQFCEYMEQKKHLQNPSEQSLLLHNFPRVTPDVAEHEPLAEHKIHDEQEHQCLHETTPSKVVNGKQEDRETYSEKNTQQYAYSPEEKAEINVLEEPHQFTATDPNRSKTSLLREISEIKAASQSEVDASLISNNDLKVNQQLYANMGPKKVESQELERIEVVDLSSDDEAKLGVVADDPDMRVWHISGQNEKYSLSLLKRWVEKTPSACKFKVWKEGQSEEKAILLSKAINLVLPQK
ncbi:uncharacterized protein At5g08430 isoform X3 [Nicotiana tabacum]